MDFDSPPPRVLSAAVHIFGASILAYCFASRCQSGHVSLKNWRQVQWARWCIMLVFVDSWLFHAYAGVLIQGYGLNRNVVTCKMAIYLCIIIYCSSKVLIYCFLIERVYVVWPHGGTRFSSKAFICCLFMMLGYFAVAVDMLIGRNSFFQGDHKCAIGLKPFASIPLLSWDLFLNIALTSMFLWPLQQAHFRDARLRKIARRTLCAALVALTTSSVNIAVLTIKHGEEMGWICLASCGVDVTINALVLYAITGYRPEENDNNVITTMNFSFQFTTHITSTSRHVVSTPDLTLPAPVQDQSKPHRLPWAVPSIRLITASADDRSVHQNSISLRDRTTDYPRAHTETVESVHCERRRECVHQLERRRSTASWWSSWWWRRSEDARLDIALETEAPVEVQVTTVQQVRDVSPLPEPLLWGRERLGKLVLDDNSD